MTPIEVALLILEDGNKLDNLQLPRAIRWPLATASAGRVAGFLWWNITIWYSDTDAGEKIMAEWIKENVPYNSTRFMDL